MGAFIGSAGWDIPRVHRERFAADGSQLARFASRLNAAEINTSFYRPHLASTYARWAGSVPAAFRFAVKIPKLVTHDRALTRACEPLTRFLGEIGGLAQSADLDRLAAAIRPNTVDTWCIFDNTGSGSAAGNALDLIARLNRLDEPHPAGQTPAPSGNVRRRPARGPRAEK